MKNEIVRIGFVLNPIAGIGGQVGVHGTDGKNLRTAIKLGAIASASLRAESALSRYARQREQHDKKIEFFAEDGILGGDLLSILGIKYKSIATFHSKTTNAADTILIANEFVKIVDIILFVGGDGTARDIYSVTSDKIPLIGIPAGVKMRSGIFTRFPEDISSILIEIEKNLNEGKPHFKITSSEILDISEGSLGEGVSYSNSNFYGVATTLKASAYMSHPKARSDGTSLAAIKELATVIAAEMRADANRLFLIGPGSSMQEIKDSLGIIGSPKGVDAIVSGKIYGKDLSEAQLSDLIELFPKSSLLIGVIGGQGFLFGRGNQQISGRVLNKIGLENIKIIASESKILNLFPVELLADLGQNPWPAMPSFIRVRTAPNKEIVCRVLQRINA